MLLSLRLDGTNLIHNLSWTQIANALELCRGAEVAPHVATYLRGNTSRDSPICWNQYRLYNQPVGKPDSILDGAILAHLLMVHGNGSDLKNCFQRLPQGLW